MMFLGYLGALASLSVGTVVLVDMATYGPVPNQDIGGIVVTWAIFLGVAFASLSSRRQAEAHAKSRRIGQHRLAQLRHQRAEYLDHESSPVAETPQANPPPALEPRRDLREVFVFLFRRDDGRCGICGKVLDGTTPSEIQIDHIVARSHGGSNHSSNLQLAHARCNAQKGARQSRPRHPHLPRLPIVPSTSPGPLGLGID